MNRILVRIVAVLLVPCVLAEPASAVIFDHPLSPCGRGWSPQAAGVRGSAFLDQALSLRPAGVPPLNQPQDNPSATVWKLVVQEEEATAAAPAAIQDQSEERRLLAEFPGQVQEWNALEGEVYWGAVTAWRGEILPQPRKIVRNESDGHYFNRHLVIALLDEYFRKIGLYRTPHIARPLARLDKGYFYEFAPGKDIHLVHPKQIAVGHLLEWDAFRRAFRSAGIDMTHDLGGIAGPGKNIVIPDEYLQKEPFEPTEQWIRIDAHSLRVDRKWLAGFLRDHSPDLEKFLGHGKWGLLQHAANHADPMAGDQATSEAAFLLTRYQREILGIDAPSAAALGSASPGTVPALNEQEPGTAPAERTEGSDILSLVKPLWKDWFGVTTVQEMAALLIKKGHKILELSAYRPDDTSKAGINEALARYKKSPKSSKLKKLNLEDIRLVRSPEGKDDDRQDKKTHWHGLVYVELSGNVVIHEEFLAWLTKAARNPEDAALYLAAVLGHENVGRTARLLGVEDDLHAEALDIFPLTQSVERWLETGRKEPLPPAAAIMTCEGFRGRLETLRNSLKAAPSLEQNRDDEGSLNILITRLPQFVSQLPESGLTTTLGFVVEFHQKYYATPSGPLHQGDRNEALKELSNILDHWKWPDPDVLLTYRPIAKAPELVQHRLAPPSPPTEAPRILSYSDRARALLKNGLVEKEGEEALKAKANAELLRPKKRLQILMKLRALYREVHRGMGSINLFPELKGKTGDLNDQIREVEDQIRGQRLAYDGDQTSEINARKQALLALVTLARIDEKLANRWIEEYVLWYDPLERPRIHLNLKRFLKDLVNHGEDMFLAEDADIEIFLTKAYSLPLIQEILKEFRSELTHYSPLHQEVFKRRYGFARTTLRIGTSSARQQAEQIARSMIEKITASDRILDHSGALGMAPSKGLDEADLHALQPLVSESTSFKGRRGGYKNLQRARIAWIINEFRKREGRPCRFGLEDLAILLNISPLQLDDMLKWLQVEGILKPVELADPSGLLAFMADETKLREWMEKSVAKAPAAAPGKLPDSRILRGA